MIILEFWNLKSEFSSLTSEIIDILNFNSKSPICLCGLEDETTVHYFLCCPHYQSQRNILISDISEIICSDVTVLLNDHLNQILMYGNNVYIPNCNKLIIEQFILFIKSSRRFKQLEAFS